MLFLSAKLKKLVCLLGKIFGRTNSVALTDSRSVCFKTKLSEDETGFEKNWVTNN